LYVHSVNRFAVAGFQYNQFAPGFIVESKSTPTTVLYICRSIAAMNQLVRQGITLQGNWSFASFIGIVGGTVMLMYPATRLYGPCIIFLLLPVFLSIRGTDINHHEKTIRKWQWWYGIKFGKTISFENYTTVGLRNFYACNSIGCKSVNGTFTANTFEIWISGSNKPNVLVTEFQDYKKARHFLEAFSAASGLPFVDDYAEKMQRAQTPNPSNVSK